MQNTIDPGLAAYIESIRAIDNHSHALPAQGPNPNDWERPDPLGKTPFHYPVRLRVRNPEYVEAWKALYDYTYSDMAEDHVREALWAKLRLVQAKGESYPSWVLDRSGIETMLVNMESLGPGQDAPRFRWVTRADPLLHPFAGREEDGTDGVPTTLELYVDTVVKTRIQRWKNAGALAIKFGIAYSRSLDVADVPGDEAEAIYRRGLRNPTLSPGDSKGLQDALFRAVSREAGKSGLPVHIHTGVGAEPYFNISGSNPMLLEPTFNDATLRHTTFVMLHGGWPFEREAGVMLLKPNVRLDFSAQPFLRSTEALSVALKGWLEWYPERVLFGTDAYPDDTPLANWEEKTWLVTRTVRKALSLALTRMMAEGQVSRSRAEELAYMVLRGNAAALYGLS
jgi:hypothetical protein